MALSDEQIEDLAEDGLFFRSIYEIAREIESEVRMQDDALILQLVEALERADKISGYQNNRKTITAGRARLGRPCVAGCHPTSSQDH